MSSRNVDGESNMPGAGLPVTPTLLEEDDMTMTRTAVCARAALALLVAQSGCASMKNSRSKSG